MLKGGVISTFPLPDFPPKSRLPEIDADLSSPSLAVDVVNVEEAIIAERAGACAVMVRPLLFPPRCRRNSGAQLTTSLPQALERVPSDIRRDGGVARMSDPKMIKEIMAAVSIPVRFVPLLLVRR